MYSLKQLLLLHSLTQNENGQYREIDSNMSF